MLVTQTFSDIDEHAAQMSGFEQRYVQLSPGRFRGVFTSLKLPQGVGFDLEWVEQALHQEAGVPAATLSVITFFDITGPSIFNGRKIGNLDTVILPAGTALDVRSPQNAKVAVVSMPTHALHEEMSAWAGPQQAWRGLKAPLHLSGGRCESFSRSTLRPLLHALAQQPAWMADGRTGASIADELLQAALHLLADSEPDDGVLEIGSARRRREVFITARDAIGAADTAEMSIGTLCKAAGVSRRTLEYCFDEAVGLSPLQYLKARRLNSVRRELAAGRPGLTTVGDVAARYGIWHLGRLSKEYSQLFGELPSTTLRR